MIHQSNLTKILPDQILSKPVIVQCTRDYLGAKRGHKNLINIKTTLAEILFKTYHDTDVFSQNMNSSAQILSPLIFRMKIFNSQIIHMIKNKITIKHLARSRSYHNKQPPCFPITLQKSRQVDQHMHVCRSEKYLYLPTKIRVKSKDQ